MWQFLLGILAGLPLGHFGSAIFSKIGELFLDQYKTKRESQQKALRDVWDASRHLQRAVWSFVGLHPSGLVAWDPRDYEAKQTEIFEKFDYALLLVKEFARWQRATSTNSVL